MDPSEIVNIAQRVTVTGLLSIAVVGGFRRWYVWGWAYDKVEQDRDEWKALALRLMHVAERVTPST